MSIYDLAMQDKEFRKLVLIEFGFGEHIPLKVEKWLKKNYPYKVAEWRKLRVSLKENVTPLYQQGMTMEERTALLEKEEKMRLFNKYWN